MEAISALLSAPNKEMTPPNTQHINTQPEECSSAAIGATFLYTPDPMIFPMTRKMAKRKPSVRFSREGMLMQLLLMDQRLRYETRPAWGKKISPPQKWSGLDP